MDHPPVLSALEAWFFFVTLVAVLNVVFASVSAVEIFLVQANRLLIEFGSPRIQPPLADALSDVPG